MTDEEYLSAQHLLVVMRATAETIDVEGVLRSIARAEAMGPIMDPTLFREAIDRLRFIRKVAEAVRTLKAIELPEGMQITRPGQEPSGG